MMNTHSLSIKLMVISLKEIQMTINPKPFTILEIQIIISLSDSQLLDLLRIHPALHNEEENIDNSFSLNLALCAPCAPESLNLCSHLNFL